MREITDQKFNDLIAQSLDELPDEYTSRISNVLITYEDQPTEQQRLKLKLRGNETLFGLYEGIPMTARGNGYSGVVPDKITIFKLPMLHAVRDEASLKAMVKHTLWHEIAHYFGLNHDRIHEIERNWT
jgi:predicted Zn-dependent protease with MMP-like domain